MAMSKTGKLFLLFGGILLALLVVAVIAIAFAARNMGEPSVANNSVLVLSISGELPDYVAEEPLAKAFGISQPQSFTSLLTQLRKAKVDPRIGAVVLDINFPGIGWGKADELRDAIKDLKTSGKPVYAYMEIGMNKEYYIATAADKIFLPPSGDIYINGLAAKYKSAPDQYTKTAMGDGQREVTNALLDEFFGRFTNAIAESRKKSVEDVKALIDSAPYNAKKAKELGLIDDAYYREQVDTELKAKLRYRETDTLRTIRGGEYREIPSDTLGLNNGERVAVIYASGAIMSGRSSSGVLNGEMLGSDTIVAAVNDAANDNSVKAIVLRVDSGGGSTLASDLMWYASKMRGPKNRSWSRWAMSQRPAVITSLVTRTRSSPNHRPSPARSAFLPLSLISKAFTTGSVSRTNTQCVAKMPVFFAPPKNGRPKNVPRWNRRSAASITTALSLRSPPDVRKRPKKQMPSVRAASGPEPKLKRMA
ncbi:MAG: S49 family peptidase [Chloracidobacterium sp.]|nr:S49 family peptidase [Chloracidobacterium sp.]